MRRPIYVRQSEAGPNAHNLGDYWYTVSMGNGEPILTSKMYRSRHGAIRAARAFLRRLAGEVVFAYWQGTTPMQEAEAAALGRPPRGTLKLVTERLHFRGTTGPLVYRVRN